MISLAWHGAPAGSSITEGTAPIPFMVEAFRDAFLVMTALSIVGFFLSFKLRDPVLIKHQLQRSEAKRELVGEL